MWLTVPSVNVFSLEKRIKDVMHKAFWDCLEGQLREEPPSYHHAIKLLAEIKEVKTEAGLS